MFAVAIDKSLELGFCPHHSAENNDLFLRVVRGDCPVNPILKCPLFERMFRRQELSER